MKINVGGEGHFDDVFTGPLSLSDVIVNFQFQKYSQISKSPCACLSFPDKVHFVHSASIWCRTVYKKF